MARQMLEEKKKQKDQKGVALAFMLLGQTFSIQGRYDSAILLLNNYLQMLPKAGSNYRDTIDAYSFMAHLYSRTGDYWKSFEYSTRSIEMAKANHDTTEDGFSMPTLTRLYMFTGDYKKQLQYAFINLKNRMGSLAHPYGSIGTAYLAMGQYDSALYFQQLYLRVIDSLTPDEKIRNKFRAVPLGYISSINLAKKEYDKVIHHFKGDLTVQNETGDFIWTLQALYHLASAYQGKKNVDSAMHYARELYQLANRAGQKEYTRDGSRILATIFDQLKQTDSAFFYFKQYQAIKDTMAVAQLGIQMALYDYSTVANEKINNLNAEKRIREQQLENESQARKMLIGGILLFTIVGVILFRNIVLKRKNENLQLRQQASELEMQALRAQMNPHFIFNCLSSINRFILKNEADAASDYLTRFSRLIRMVLNHSKEPDIALEDELEMLRLYLEMEQLRFKNSFTYAISCDSELDMGAIQVPPLLLQPFAENAIWHGLLHKKTAGHLFIEIKEDNEGLTFLITDNGIGRKAAASFKTKSVEKQKSMGLQITKERLALMNCGKNNFFEIEDLADAEGNATGTKVVLRIKQQDTGSQS